MAGIPASTDMKTRVSQPSTPVRLNTIAPSYPAASTASSAKSLDFCGSILMPGLIVEDSVTDLTYRPLAAAGLAR